jgi:glycerol-3-phosphate O-acyltransferase
MREKDKERVVVEVVQRVFDLYNRDPGTVERALFDTFYEEGRRLETEKDRAKARKQAAVYNREYHEAVKASPARQRELLKQIIQGFAEEVAGHFDPRIYALSTRVVPHALTVLLNTLSPLRVLGVSPGGMGTLEEQVVIQGETEAFKTMARQGTTVLVSTHASNMDSIILGYILFRLGLPPYTYGAGLNLFHHKLLGFFMHNLGAYKVDRRKKAFVYKDVLKTYAGCTLELGYHNMFFPGGTRSRSGSVESRLKMGLLGMGLDAYVHNLIAGKDRPDIFVVPCTINYQLVLEAETLIDDYLKEVGKSRYIIEDDEFSRIDRVLDFVGKLFSLNSRIHVVISRPLDVFGNQVDDQGRSLDRRGREVDRKKYVYRNGAPVFDPQRDQEYTRELARSVMEAFHKDTLVNSTNLLSRSVFGWLRARNRDQDLYRLLRTGGLEESLPLQEVYRGVARDREVLRGMESRGRLRLDDAVKNKDEVALVSEALAHLKSYHRVPALIRRGDRIFHKDRNLLYYYQNRLEGFGLPATEAAR